MIKRVFLASICFLAFGLTIGALLRARYPEAIGNHGPVLVLVLCLLVLISLVISYLIN